MILLTSFHVTNKLFMWLFKKIVSLLWKEIRFYMIKTNLSKEVQNIWTVHQDSVYRVIHFKSLSHRIKELKIIWFIKIKNHKIWLITIQVQTVPLNKFIIHYKMVNKVNQSLIENYNMKNLKLKLIFLLVHPNK
jgi:hypothetical protein